MICKNCGAKNDNNALYCEKCGKLMNPVINSKLTLIIIITIVILAIIGLIGAVLVTNNQNSSNNIESDFESISSSSGVPLNQVPNLASKISKLGANFETIEYGSITLTKNQCLYILAKAIIMIDNGQENNIPINSYSSPNNPYGTISNGLITKNQYINMAERTVAWMDNNGATPNFIGISNPGQPDISPDNLLLIFSNILVKYKSTGSLPDSINF